MQSENSPVALAENFEGHLDSPQPKQSTTADILVVSGWILHTKTPIQALTLEIAGYEPQRIPYPMFRPDVGAALPHIPNGSSSGFALKFPLTPNYSGQLALQIWATQADGERVCVWRRLVEVKPETPADRISSKAVTLWQTYAKKLRQLVVMPPRLAWKAYRTWQKGGWEMVQIKVREYVARNSLNDYLWLDNRRNYQIHVAPVLRSRLASLPRRPKISIVIPTYNPPKIWFSQAIASIQNQIYPHWELCIADDASPAAYVRELLESYAAADPRIKVTFCPVNGGAAAASNAALELATGEFVLLMDHDDLLTEEALFRVAEAIITADPDMLYSDEGMTSPEGKMLAFAFRPQFSWEYLRSHPYIVHLVGFRRALLHEIGNFNPALRISQDYDLILRAAEKAKTILHIPQVLYLWRIHTTSAGHQKQAQVMAASQEILTRHLARCGKAGRIEPGPSFNFFQTRYELPEGLKVAIIIPTKNCGQLVKQCIDSIAATTPANLYDIVLIDHNSTDPDSIAYFQSIEHQHKVMHYTGVFNFSAINNWAVSQLEASAYTHYLFCNNDIEAIAPGWLERLLELGHQKDVGIVGAKLLYPDRRIIQHAGVGVGLNGIAEHYGKFMADQLMDGEPTPGYMGSLFINREMSAVTAACMLMRRDAFEQVQGFDEQLAVGFGDVDLCLRTIAQGYRVIFCAAAVLIHHESYSRGKSTGIDPHPEDSKLFLDRWQEFLSRGDSYYNPNLSTTSTQWDVAKPLPATITVPYRIYHAHSH